MSLHQHIASSLLAGGPSAGIPAIPDELIRGFPSASSIFGTQEGSTDVPRAESFSSLIASKGPIGGTSSFLQQPQTINVLGRLGAAFSQSGSQGDRVGTAATKLAEGTQAEQRQKELDKQAKTIAAGDRAKLIKDLVEAVQEANASKDSANQPISPSIPSVPKLSNFDFSNPITIPTLPPRETPSVPNIFRDSLSTSLAGLPPPPVGLSNNVFERFSPRINLSPKQQANRNEEFVTFQERQR